MIDMYLKYDNMHTNGIFNALNCINNHVNLCINCMLSVTYVQATWRIRVHMYARVWVCVRECN